MVSIYSKFAVQIENYLLLLLSGLIILSASFITYASPHGFYIDVWQYAAGQFPYSQDIYIQNSSVLNSSQLCKFFSLFKINLLDERYGFAYHVMCSTISYFYIFKLILKFVSFETKLVANLISFFRGKSALDRETIKALQNDKVLIIGPPD